MPGQWSERDTATLVGVAASRGSNRQWPDYIDFEDRGRLSAEELKRRWRKMNGKEKANKPSPLQKRRGTPIKVRTENADVLVHPTPEGVRATIATGGEPVDDRDGESDGESRGAGALGSKAISASVPKGVGK